MKTCSKCGETKPRAAFPQKGAVCKACRCELARIHRAANTEIMRERDRVYYAANREKVIAQERAYREANIEKVRKRNRAYYVTNRERVRESNTARDKTHREQVAPHYAASRLGIPVADLAPELHAAYREQLLNKRALRELTSTLKELSK